MPFHAYKSHVGVIANLWVFILMFRLLGWKVCKRNFAFFSTLASSVMLLTIFLYYAAVAAGLAGFGKIITWPILLPYIVNIKETANYIGLSLFRLFFLVFISTFFIFSIFWFFIARNDWLKHISENLRNRTFLFIALGVFGVFSIRWFDFIDNPPNYLGEPISTTFFPPPPEETNNKIYKYDYDLIQIENKARNNLLRKAQNRPDKNIIVIISDALRADHMTLYGYERNTTPHLIEAFNRHSAVQAIRAIAVCSETICGVPGLLHSRPPELMHSNAIGLSEVLRAHGYKSYTILSGDHSNYYGLAKIYHPTDFFIDGSKQTKRFINDDMLLIDTIKSIPNHDGNNPAYFQILLQSNHVLGMRWKSSNWYQPSENYAPWLAKGIKEITEDQKHLATNYYDNGVRQADKVIKEILDLLQQKGYLENTFILITGDHGEMLGEHNLLSHTVGVYQPVLEVPAIFLRYGYDAPEISFRRWVSQVDLSPTILHEAGIEKVPTWTGVALQEPEKRPYFSFQQKWVSGLLITDNEHQGYKYWFDTKTQKDFVFNLNVDPNEENNIYDKIPKALLGKWRNLSLKNMMQSSNH